MQRKRGRASACKARGSSCIIHRQKQTSKSRHPITVTERERERDEGQNRCTPTHAVPPPDSLLSVSFVPTTLAPSPLSPTPAALSVHTCTDTVPPNSDLTSKRGEGDLDWRSRSRHTLQQIKFKPNVIKFALRVPHPQHQVDRLVCQRSRRCDWRQGTGRRRSRGGGKRSGGRTAGGLEVVKLTRRREDDPSRSGGGVQGGLA